MPYQIVGGVAQRVPPMPERAATLAQAFVDSVRAYADRPAMKAPGAAPITYSELAQRVRTAVQCLQELNVAAGDRVAICLPNCPEWAVFTYAAALLGACVIPVNIRFRSDEIAYVLRGSDAKVLITQRSFMTNSFVDRLRSIAGGDIGAGERASIPHLPSLEHILFVDGTREPGSIDYASRAGAVRATVDLDALAAQRRGDDPMWLFWTSGTTSAPKGALLPNASMEMIWKWTDLVGYRGSDRVLTSRPFFYIAGHFWTLVGPMLYGATSVICDELSNRQMQLLCKSEGVTVLLGNPLMMKDIVEASDFDPTAFRTVRLGMFGGSSMAVDELKKIRAAIGYEQLVQTYGMTEFAGFVLSTLPGQSDEVSFGSCGYPFTDVELRLADPETGATVPDGEMGMLLVRGIKLIEYLNLPEDARSRLFDGEGWYRTGDLLRRLEDGRYQFVGRSKDLIKVNGENVTAGEVEGKLMKHPEVSLVAVIGIQDAHRGEVPVAFVETRGGNGLDSHDLTQWCKSQMAPYKVPVRFFRVGPGQWPMTVSGKIAKHRLMAECGDPQGAAP